MRTARSSALFFLVSTVAGLGFFLWPVEHAGKTTVPFDLATGALLKAFPTALGIYCLLAIAVGAVIPLIPGGDRPRPGWIFSVLRIAGAALAVCYFFDAGPAWLLEARLRGVMWDKLILPVAVVIPLGAVLVAVLVNYGALDYLGTLMRPVMRPLFRLPGRSALDDLMSWLGPYSVGLYFTKQLFAQGVYTRREAYTVASCFCTVSIGFVGVVASALDVMHLFAHIFAAYFICIYLLAAIMVRLPPLSRIAETHIGPPQREEEVAGSPLDYFRAAWQRALTRAAGSPGLARTLSNGLLDGVRLSATVLGLILAVGTAALLLAYHTPIFHYLGAPLTPLLDLCGIPDAEIVAQATAAGIAEVYIPALLAREAAVEARFFVAVMSISQLIFFSSVAPMMLELFKEIPIRLHQLLAIFVLRTLLLIPLLAGLVALLRVAGVF